MDVIYRHLISGNICYNLAKKRYDNELKISAGHFVIDISDNRPFDMDVHESIDV